MQELGSSKFISGWLEELSDMQDYSEGSASASASRTVHLPEFLAECGLTADEHSHRQDQQRCSVLRQFAMSSGMATTGEVALDMELQADLALVGQADLTVAEKYAAATEALKKANLYYAVREQEARGDEERAAWSAMTSAVGLQEEERRAKLRRRS